METTSRENDVELLKHQWHVPAYSHPFTLLTIVELFGHTTTVDVIAKSESVCFYLEITELSVPNLNCLFLVRNN